MDKFPDVTSSKWKVDMQQLWMQSMNTDSVTELSKNRRSVIELSKKRRSATEMSKNRRSVKEMSKNRHSVRDMSKNRRSVTELFMKRFFNRNFSGRKATIKPLNHNSNYR
jgi:DNA topoisomerase VI subunit A